MTDFNNWLIMALMQHDDFRLHTYEEKSDTFVEIKMNVDGRTYYITIDDVTQLIKAADKPIVDAQPINVRDTAWHSS